jgi:hypothetical protein
MREEQEPVCHYPDPCFPRLTEEEVDYDQNGADLQASGEPDRLT